MLGHERRHRRSSEEHPRTKAFVSVATTRVDRIFRTKCASSAPARSAVTAYRAGLRYGQTVGRGGREHLETSFARTAINRVRCGTAAEPEQCHLPTINSGRATVSPGCAAIASSCSTSRVRASDDLHIFPNKSAGPKPDIVRIIYFTNLYHSECNPSPCGSE